MSPEERQLLSELFDRVRGQANAPRDRDAETFIADAVRAQPYAPYLLAQTVIVQEHALRAADQKIQEMQAEIERLHAQAQPRESSGGFLGGLFGGGSRPQPAPSAGPWGGQPQQPSYAPPPPPPQGGSPWGGPQAQGGPWGGQPQQPQGGGFLRNAMGAAAGVAGGVLLADSIRSLLSGGHNAALFGGGGGLGGLGAGGLGAPGGETIINNYNDTPAKGQDQSLFDAPDDNSQDLSDADFSGDDDFSGGDDYSSDV
ncbi:MAG TPA: DUF2076 domain-containing protein [Rhodoblastus sp.]|nr:DUF2076 domain-containing protein [Rhodoblastus sp.]